MQSVVWNEAMKINGADPDFHRRDMWQAIHSGQFPEWELGLQLFDEKFADEFPFAVLDATKLIPEELIPIRKVGRLVLDRCVDNFFAETEQVAFCTNNIVLGVDFSNDPLLQGRNFSYLDTQLSRLGGPNFTRISKNFQKPATLTSGTSLLGAIRRRSHGNLVVGALLALAPFDVFDWIPKHRG
jgi:catalase